MALRMSMARNAGHIKDYPRLLQRWTHVIAQSAPLNRMISPTPVSPTFVLPESGQTPNIGSPGIGSEFPGFYIGSGSMELMAVPKRKTSPHKRGIRNGPKALKPVRVIVRCKSCGRVKLPHFFCCSGLRENPDGQKDATN